MIDRKKLKNLFFENGSYKLVALIITLILWITVLGQKGSVTTKLIDVEFILGDKLILVNDPVRSVECRLTGSKMSLKKISNENLSVTLDLSKLQPGRKVIPIPQNSLQLPLGVKVLSMNPSSITVHLEELKVALLPVRVKYQKLKPGYKIAAVTPDRLAVKGASSAVTDMNELQTENLDFSRLEDDSDMIHVVALVLDPSRTGILPLDKKEVTITLKKTKTEKKNK